MDKTKIREIRPIFKLENFSKFEIFGFNFRVKIVSKLNMSQKWHWNFLSRRQSQHEFTARRKISTAVKISWPRLTINLQLNWTFYNPTTTRPWTRHRPSHVFTRPARPDQIRIICSHADQKRNYDFEIMKMKGMKFIISSIYASLFQPMKKRRLDQENIIDAQNTNQFTWHSL